ncbi:MAG: hypothetical protein GXP08_16380 [Gammaproteobacteria bacterium]|nr:hypothetical protein [Gammaproteobacteria bacterium]
MSQISSCLNTAHLFLLSREEAIAIVEYQKQIIEENWTLVCDETSLSETNCALFWKRRFSVLLLLKVWNKPFLINNCTI